MDDGTLRTRLWAGFARLQTLLGGHAGPGSVIERDGLVASVVPNAPESPTLNAAVALDPMRATEHLEELHVRYAGASVRRWGVWLDGSATEAALTLLDAGLMVTASSPGMGAPIAQFEALDARAAAGEPRRTDLATVGRVNDIAYGN